jgi:hypothetical protein
MSHDVPAPIPTFPPSPAHSSALLDGERPHDTWPANLWQQTEYQARSLLHMLAIYSPAAHDQRFD